MSRGESLENNAKSGACELTVCDIVQKDCVFVSGRIDQSSH